MTKINIKIKVPIIDKVYEIFTPDNILVGNLLYMFLSSINEMNNLDLRDLIFYDSITGGEIDLDSYIYNCINNGSLIVLG